MGSTTLKSSHSSPSTRTSSSITPPANTHLPTLDNSRPLINSRPQKPSIPIYPIHPLRVFLHHYLGHTQHPPLCRSAQHPPLSQPPMIATIISPPISPERSLQSL